MPSKNPSNISVVLHKGQDEAAQMQSFQNATFQTVGEKLVMSVATTVTVPDEVISQGEDAVATWVEHLLWKAGNSVEGNALAFEVYLGASDTASV